MNKIINFYQTWFYKPRVIYNGKKWRIAIFNTWSLYYSKYKSALGPFRIVKII